MIESIQIASTASYGSTPQDLDGLSEFNFLFGSNGSGKTTITKVIADEGQFPTCRVSWKAGTKMQAMVYNRDFIEKNFKQNPDLKGIFTLGAENLETNRKISEAKGKIDEFTKDIENWNSNLECEDGLNAKFQKLEVKFKDECWIQKQKYDERFKDAFQGFRGSAERFKKRILHQQTNNLAPLKPLSELKESAEEIFGETPIHEEPVPTLDTSEFVALESNLILKKAVIGKTDVDIAAMIEKLGISDWVNEGQIYYSSNQGICPFCQQETTEDFARSLNNFFDETYESDKKTIEGLLNSYVGQSKRFQDEVEAILKRQCRFLDNDGLKAKNRLLKVRIASNLQLLEAKKKEPSRRIELESISGIAEEIREIINGANSGIENHNQMVANHGQEKRQLAEKVWKYVLEELKSDLEDYQKAHRGFTKGIEALTEKIKNKKSERTLLNRIQNGQNNLT